MRQRHVVNVDTHTGTITETRELLDDAGFDQRIAELKGSVPIEDVQAKTLRLSCNGCDHSEYLDFDNPQMPAGWVERDNGDFCSSCV